MEASEIKLGIMIIYKPLGQKCRIIDFDVEARDNGSLVRVTTRFLGDKVVLRIKACTLSES